MVEEPLKAKAVTGFIPDTPFLFERLTGSEFLRFAGRLYGMGNTAASEAAADQLDFFDLTDWADFGDIIQVFFARSTPSINGSIPPSSTLLMRTKSR